MIFDLQHQLHLVVYAACNEEKISLLVTMGRNFKGIAIEWLIFLYVIIDPQDILKKKLLTVQ